MMARVFVEPTKNNGRGPVFFSKKNGGVSVPKKIALFVNRMCFLIP